MMMTQLPGVKQPVYIMIQQIFPPYHKRQNDKILFHHSLAFRTIGSCFFSHTQLDVLPSYYSYSFSSYYQLSSHLVLSLFLRLCVYFFSNSFHCVPTGLLCVYVSCACVCLKKVFFFSLLFHRLLRALLYHHLCDPFFLLNLVGWVSNNFLSEYKSLSIFNQIHLTVFQSIKTAKIQL